MRSRFTWAVLIGLSVALNFNVAEAQRGGGGNKGGGNGGGGNQGAGGGNRGGGGGGGRQGGGNAAPAARAAAPAARAAAPAARASAPAARVAAPATRAAAPAARAAAPRANPTPAPRINNPAPRVAQPNLPAPRSGNANAKANAAVTDRAPNVRANANATDRGPNVRANTNATDRGPNAKANANAADRAPSVRANANAADRSPAVINGKANADRTGDRKPSARANANAADRAPSVRANANAADRSPAVINGNANADRTGDRKPSARANGSIAVRKPVVDNFNNTTKLQNNLKVLNNQTAISARNKANVSAVIANPNNPRHWNNWGNSWNNYGVNQNQRNWYRGSWGGFNGPGFYTPFGFGYGNQYGYGRGGFGYGGYGGYGNYGYGGLGGLGLLLGNRGYGLNPWAMNSLGYQWGYYGGFNNPYYASNYSMPYNYGQPVYLAYQSSEVQAPQAVQSDFEAARTAFRQGQYDDALNLLDRVVKENPSDTTAHELRALTLFAMGRYDESAATLNSLLAVAPGWSWETMSGLYPNINTYTQQLRDLEAFTKDEPKSAAGRFVLGYHYLVAGHQDAARRQFERVVDLEPKDRVAQQLLSGLEKADDRRASVDPPPAPPAEREEVVKDGEETDLVGTWTAQRDKNMPFELTLSDNGKFTWIAGDGDKASKVSGNYELEGQTLVLDGGKNESLVGHLASEGKNRFHFKLLGSPADDPGLEFERLER